jgi:hypothetical protein
MPSARPNSLNSCRKSARPPGYSRPRSSYFGRDSYRVESACGRPRRQQHQALMDRGLTTIVDRATNPYWKWNKADQSQSKKRRWRPVVGTLVSRDGLQRKVYSLSDIALVACPTRG